MLKYKNIEITKYKQSGFRVDWEGDENFRNDPHMYSPDIKQVIYIDPFQIPDGEPKADLIFISHDHFDHYDPESIKKLLKPSTVVLSNKLVHEKLANIKEISKFESIAPSTQKGINGMVYLAISAFNIDKFREPGNPFHSKESEGMGFILEFNVHDTSNLIRIYFMGDTDFVEELMCPVDIDILMIPVSGTYVMTKEEALEASKIINAKIVIPMHYEEDIIGKKEDALYLKDNLGDIVKIL